MEKLLYNSSSSSEYKTPPSILYDSNDFSSSKTSYSAEYPKIIESEIEDIDQKLESIDEKLKILDSELDMSYPEGDDSWAYEEGPWVEWGTSREKWLELEAEPEIQKELSEREKLAKYEIGRKLGQGSFGKVMKAVDKETGEVVAIKIIENLEKPLPDDPEYQYYKHLLRKKSINVNKDVKSKDEPICHPNIICYKDVFSLDDKVYVIMEYFDGITLYKYLKSFLKRNQIMGIEEIVSILREIVTGLEYLNSINVIHRDLKLENIMINKEGLIKIVDYGLSCFKDIYKSCSGRVGSPYYVSPQLLDSQLMSSADNDTLIRIYKANDIWSLGVITYALAHNGLPFVGDSLSELYQEIETITVKSDYRGKSSTMHSARWLNRLISRMLMRQYRIRVPLDKLALALKNDGRPRVI